jgi:hypothetical protein
VSDQFDSEPPESRKFSAFFTYVWFVHVLGFARESVSEFRLVSDAALNQTIDVRRSISEITQAREVAGIRWDELRKLGINWIFNKKVRSRRSRWE